MQNEGDLIKVILSKVGSDPFHEWKIGVTETGRMNSEGYRHVTSYCSYPMEEVEVAYRHFTSLGMVAIPLIGRYALNLYTFKIGGEKLPENLLRTSPVYDENGVDHSANVEQQKLLVALNAYASAMKMAAVFSPIASRKVR